MNNSIKNMILLMGLTSLALSQTAMHNMNNEPMVMPVLIS